MELEKLSLVDRAAQQLREMIIGVGWHLTVRMQSH